MICSKCYIQGVPLQKQDGLTLCAGCCTPVGVKHDQEKSRVDLLSGPFLLELGKIMGHGSVKYGARNWLHVEKIRYIAAAGRHYFQYLGGEALDKDSGVSHLVCCAANLMILWEKDQRASSSDSRSNPGTPTTPFDGG